MNETIGKLFGQESLPGETLFILYVAATFFIGGLVVILILFASRIVKSYRELRAQELSKKFQRILNSIVVNAVTSENASPDSAFQFHLSQIELLIAGSGFRKQLLINQLIRLKKNLTGASAEALKDIYHRLSLREISLKGLTSFQWFNKARAMRELSEMGIRESAPKIARYLHSRKTALREEAFMSLANLTLDRPMEFLDTYQFAITDWMQLNVYSVLQRTDVRNLPQFSRWFNHTNISVRLFAIRMASQFKQYQAANAFKELLEDTDPHIRYVAVKAMHDLEMDQFTDDVLKLKPQAWANPQLGKIFVQYFGKVSLTPEAANILREFMHHDDYEIRFAAISSLLKNAAQLPVEEKSERIIRHLSEPLLN